MAGLPRQCPPLGRSLRTCRSASRRSTMRPRAAASPLARPLRSVHRTRWIFFCRRLRSTARAGRTQSRPRPSPPSLSIIRSSCRRYARAAHATPRLQTSPLPSPTSLTHRLLPPSPIFSQVKSSELPEELRENPTAEQQPASITKECDATTVVEYAVNQGSDDGSSSSPSDGSDGGVHLPVTEVVTVN